MTRVISRFASEELANAICAGSDATRAQIPRNEAEKKLFIITCDSPAAAGGQSRPARLRNQRRQITNALNFAATALTHSRAVGGPLLTVGNAFFSRGTSGACN